MKYFISALLAIIAGLIIYILLQRNEVDLGYQNDIALKEAEIINLSRKADTMIQRLRKDSAYYKSREVAYNEQIKSLKKKAYEKRVVVQKIILSDSSIHDFVVIQDSIIFTQDQRIDTLLSEKETQRRTYNQIFSVQESKYKASREINESLQSAINGRDKENKRLKRQNTILKIGIGTAVIGGAALAF